MSLSFKEIDLKTLNKEQKEVVREINAMIIEYQDIFQEQPQELVISKYSFDKLLENKQEEIKYLLLGKIKIFSVQ